MSFNDAQDNCRSKSGANLVSVQTMYDEMFITSYVKEKSAWIGLQYDQINYEWSWLDNWPVWVSNWGEGEPGSDINKMCAYRKDAPYGSEWLTTSCTNMYPSICKTSTGIKFSIQEKF